MDKLMYWAELLWPILLIWMLLLVAYFTRFTKK